MTLFPASRDVVTDRGDAGRRLDLVLRRHLADVAVATRTQIQVWIENGQVRVDGQPVRRVATRARSGAHVSILLPDRAPRIGVTAEDLALDVLYEDDHLLAVNKPAGILTPNEEEAKRFIDWGYTFVAVGSDLGLLAKNADALAKRFKG